jgi:predicted RNA-binding protein (virulence factor B family)
MSKKTFKMTIGNLYKKRMINIDEKGIGIVKEG